MKNIPVRHISNYNELNLESFSIRTVRDLLDGRDIVQDLHRHDFFYLLVLKKGAGHHAIDFTPYEVSNHSVFFMRPGQVHELTLKAGSTGYLLEFKTGFYHGNDPAANGLLRKASAVNHYPFGEIPFKKLMSLMTSIFQEYTDKQEGYQDVLKANLDILCIELIRQTSKIVSHDITLYAQERLNNFLELLETQITTHKQVSYYADRLNLSPYQLNAITKKNLGKTCSELIDEYSILETKRYLLATSNQITQIASHLGYEDISYFIRFFKKHTGYSPEAFRNSFR